MDDTAGKRSMSKVVGAGRGNAAGEARALQLRVPAEELAEFGDSESARNLERLAADKELVLQLALRGYAGPSWQDFATALAEYGFQVMTAWIASGAIFAKCAAKGIGLGGRDRSCLSPDDAQEIAGETVALAIRAFREKVLIPGRWDPSRGASLKTFFVGQCIFQFPNEFRRWTSEQGPAEVHLSALAQNLEPTQRQSQETLADLSRELTKTKTLSDAHPVKLQVLMEMGFSQREIAELLGITEKAVQMKIYRARRSGP